MSKMPIRLAMREEQGFWRAYIAAPDTMEHAKLVGSIAIGPLRDREHGADLKERFMTLMMDVLAYGIKQVTGQEPDDFEVESGPESERAGHA